MANLGNTVVSGKLTVTDSATIKGKKVITIADLATVATTGSYNDLLNKPSILLLNNAPSWTWGTLTTANGYTLLGSSNESGGGSVAFAAKGGQTSIQIDGRYYDQEGKYQLVDTADLSSALASYVTLSTAQTISGTKTFSTAGGFVYSGIESASANSDRPIWYGHDGKVSVPVYSTNLTFNPSTGNLKSDHVVTTSLIGGDDSSASITFDSNSILIGDDTLGSTGTYPADVFIYSDVFTVTSRLSEFKYNLRAKTLTSTQNSAYIDFITNSGVNFGVKGNSGTVYDLATIKSNSERTIGTGTLTIQKNGTTVNTFSANSTSNVTANIEVPTIPSSLKNPYALTIKNGSGTTVTYDGSSSVDLASSGVFHATTAVAATSASNSDKVGGYYASVDNVASTAVVRDLNCFVYATYYNSNIGQENTMSPVSVYCSNDNWIRKMSTTSFRNTNAVRKWCMVGSDTASTSGYYKFASQTMSGYGNTNITFMVTSTYNNYYSVILQFQMRSDNTSISCKNLGWLVRNGFDDSNEVICSISGMTYTLYFKQHSTQYGRIMIEVLSESGISSNSTGIILYSSTTPESTTPTITKGDNTLGYVATAIVANSAGSATKATQDGDGNPINSTYTKLTNLSAAINNLSTGTSAPQDNDYYIAQYAGGGTSTTTYHRRPHSALWTYINSKVAASYVSKSGSTLTSGAQFSWADPGVSNTTTTSVTNLGGFQWTGKTDWVKLYGELPTALDQCLLVLQFGDDNSNYLSVRNASGTETAKITATGNINASAITVNGNSVIHSGNIGSQNVNRAEYWGNDTNKYLNDLSTQDTDNTWVPVMVDGKMRHRVIPTVYNNDPSTFVHNTTVTLAGKDDSWTANFTLNSDTNQTVRLDEVTAKSIYMDDSYNMSTVDTSSRLHLLSSTESMTSGHNGTSSKWSIISVSNGKNGTSNSQLAIGSGYQLRFRSYIEGNSTYGIESHWGDWRDLAFEDDVSSMISASTKYLVTRDNLYSWAQGYGSWNLVNTIEDKTNFNCWLYRDLINTYDDTITSTSYLLIGYVASGWYSSTTTSNAAYTGRFQSIHIHGWWGGSSYSTKNQVDCIVSFYYVSSATYYFSAKGWMHRAYSSDDIIITSNGYIYLKTSSSYPRCQIFVDRNGPSVLASSDDSWSTSSISGTSLSSKLVDFANLVSPKITINGTAVSLGSSATINPPSNIDVILRTLSFRGGSSYSISGIYCTSVSIYVDGSVGSEGSGYFTAPTTYYYSTFSSGSWKYAASIISGGYINTLCIGIEQTANKVWLKRALSGGSQYYTVQIIGIRYC